MTSRLIKRVQKLETKESALPWIPVRLFKFDMTARRIPPNERKVNPSYDLKKPDFKTCCEFGRRNIEAIKAIRTAKLAGKNVLKIIRTIV